jgi:nitroimidazol reductase NimA-like FMN-containing flavoprotein (pyridoxamine 5'-phosphate oxidase superfamily)
VHADRPFMPGYGIRPPGEGTGLLPWAWALRRLAESRYYWVCTVGPDRRPHATPVWAVWHDESVWFSCGDRSRKARNLTTNPHCTVATDDASGPVIVEGEARRVSDRAAVEAVRSDMVAKYDYEMTLEFLLANAMFAVRPVKVIGLVEDDFTGSPTRWSAVD